MTKLVVLSSNADLFDFLESHKLVYSRYEKGAPLSPELSSRSLYLCSFESMEGLPSKEILTILNSPHILIGAKIPEVISDTAVNINRRNFFLCGDCKFENLLSLIACHAEMSLSADRLNDYICDSFQNIVNQNILEMQKQEIEALNEKLLEISRVDYLTKLLNRRALMEEFENEKKRALRDRWRVQKAIDDSENCFVGGATIEAPSYESRAKGTLTEHIGNFACIMIDVDFFKKINDSYGHLVGDQVLKGVGEVLREPGLFRENDIIGRYGGEEFIILLPETNLVNAMIPAERLRQKVKEVDFFDEDKNVFHISISLGVSEFIPDELSTDEMIKRADVALYYAKQNGRDQVVAYSKEIEAQLN